MFLWTRSDVTESRNTSCALLLNFLFVALEVPVCLQRRGLILQRAVRVGQLHPRVLSVCATVCLHSVWELQHCVLQASRSLCVSLLLLPSFNNCYLYCWLIPIPAAFACCSLHLQQALYCFHCRDMCVKGSGGQGHLPASCCIDHKYCCRNLRQVAGHDKNLQIYPTRVSTTMQWSDNGLASEQ